jgi:hypothetical protein
VYGGANGNVVYNTVYHANFTLGSMEENGEVSWEVIPNQPDEDDGELPVGRYFHAAFLYFRDMYVYGGIDENGTFLHDMWLFDTRNDFSSKFRRKLIKCRK